MSKPNTQTGNGGGSVIAASVISGASLYFGLQIWPSPAGDDTQRLIASCFVLFGVWGFGRVFVMASRKAKTLMTLWRAFRPKDDYGSAGWFSERDLRKHKLHTASDDSSLIGVVGKSPLFLWTETHTLIIAPAGSGKSSTVISLKLLSNGNNALISDIKGELHEQFAAYRAEKFGKRIIVHDPTDPNCAAFNPLDKIYDLVMADSPDALTWTRGMVRQLYPEPPKEGANRFFRDGARVDIVTLIFAVVVACPQEQRNLGTVYRALVDEAFMNDLLLEAARCELLGGEISMMADDVHRMAFGDDNSSNTFEQFRMGAVQRMEVFGAGNYLAKVSGSSDFSFTDLKSDDVDIYLKVDFRNKDVLGPWVGLLQWFAAQELVAFGNNKPVEFILDEFCNAPVRNLPEILTLLRSYGVKVTMATQDLSDIKRVYGEDALETILSETDIKQFLAGIRSKRTLEYIEANLGDDTINVSGFALSENTANESLSLKGRKLRTSDELRRMDSNEQLIFFANHKPISARKVAVFAIDPWRKKIAPNSMYGDQRKLDPVMIKIKGKTASVKRRAYWKVPSRRNLRPMFGLFFSSFIPVLIPSSAVFLVLAGLAFVHWFGFPYLLTHYTYSGYGKYRTYHECHYSGPSPFVTFDDCPLFKLKKVW